MILILNNINFKFFTYYYNTVFIFLNTLEMEISHALSFCLSTDKYN